MTAELKKKNGLVDLTEMQRDFVESIYLSMLDDFEGTFWRGVNLGVRIGGASIEAYQLKSEDWAIFYYLSGKGDEFFAVITDDQFDTLESCAKAEPYQSYERFLTAQNWAHEEADARQLNTFWLKGKKMKAVPVKVFGENDIYHR